MRSISRLFTLREKSVIILSGTCGVLSLIILVALAIVWTYWSDMLNITCLESNCGCIFFGVLRGNSFNGGHSLWCKVLTYSTLAVSVVSFFVAGYFFSKRREVPKHFPSRVNQDYREENPAHQTRRSRFSTAFKIFCGILAFATFVYAATLTEGYSHTCREYRGFVKRTLASNADVTDMIQNRLSCGATYDFLDYLETRTQKPYSAGPQYSYYRRTFHLDTGSILLLAISLSWINVAIWIFLTITAIFCSS